MKTFNQFINEVKKPTGDLKKACWTGYTAVGMKEKNGRKVPNCVPEETQIDETAAWQRKEGKRESGGLNQKGVDSYRREHPGSKLKTAVTTKPSKLKAGSAAANRRKSFCARMSGMKKRLTSAKTAHDPNSRINKSLRKWNC
jgi:predicted RNase H-like nuclease